MPAHLALRCIALFSLVLSVTFIATFSYAHVHANNSDLNAETDKKFELLSAFVNKEMSEKTVPDVAIGVLHNGEQVMQQSSLLAMQATQAPKIGTEDAIGITWHLSSIGNLRVVAHGGATIGQQAYLLLIPEKDFAIAVLTNAGNGRALHQKVIAFALEQYFDAKKPRTYIADTDTTRISRVRRII